MLIAVYGTLKKGKHNNHYMGKSKLIKASHTGEGYALFFNQLPYLVKRPEGQGCEIEIYQVDQATLEDLDRLEGHPHFYTRSFLRNEDGEPVYIYIYNDEDNYFTKKSLKKAINSF